MKMSRANALSKIGLRSLGPMLARLPDLGTPMLAGPEGLFLRLRPSRWRRRLTLNGGPPRRAPPVLCTVQRQFAVLRQPLADEVGMRGKLACLPGHALAVGPQAYPFCAVSFTKWSHENDVLPHGGYGLPQQTQQRAHATIGCGYPPSPHWITFGASGNPAVQSLTFGL